MASQPIYAGDTAVSLKKAQDKLISAAKLLESADSTINENLSGSEFSLAIKYIEKIIDSMSDEVDSTNTLLEKLTDLVNDYNSKLYDKDGNRIYVNSVNYRSGKKLTYTPISTSSTTETTSTNTIKAIDTSTDRTTTTSTTSSSSSGGNTTYTYSTGSGSSHSHSTGGTTVASYSTYSYTASSSQSGHVADYKDYIVAENATTLSSYASYLRSKGICQNSNTAEYGGKCLGFAYTQAYGYFTNDRSLTADNGAHYKYATKFRGVDGTKEQILTEIYNEIKAGRPVILQVNGNKQGTSRHFVTVVGFKKSVTSAEELKETDLLILDSWDAQIESMNGKGSGTRFMTQGTETGNGNYGYRIYKMR